MAIEIAPLGSQFSDPLSSRGTPHSSHTSISPMTLLNDPKNTYLINSRQKGPSPYGSIIVLVPTYTCQAWTFRNVRGTGTVAPRCFTNSSIATFFSNEVATSASPSASPPRNPVFRQGEKPTFA